ncbi:hypothetical protein [Planotetraspora kaengkrachanensis]|uniref:hypothetical protein n=1 Tax=Planotetraspora kaengkrachanensis TaxID=575193 RepID=UPI001945AD45|nr:hypothetical protein [Planotetraspora kaengkrachanensis]
MVAAQPAQAVDCTGSGLISTVTSGLCSILGGVDDTVDGVTDVVDGATGGLTAPVTEGVDAVVGGVTDGTGGAVSEVGEAVDDTVDSAVDAVGGTVKKVTDPLTGGSGGSGGTGGSGSGGSGGGGTPGGGAEPTPGACIELLGLGGDCDGEQAVPPPADTPKKPRLVNRPPVRTPAGTLPSEPARTIELPRFTPAGGKDVAPDPRVNLDEDGAIPLLWPGNQEIPGLQGGSKTDRIRPAQPYDAAGTALTAALLLSAVLATRVVSARRARMEQRESIPFEGGARAARGSGRHRLA